MFLWDHVPWHLYLWPAPSVLSLNRVLLTQWPVLALPGEDISYWHDLCLIFPTHKQNQANHMTFICCQKYLTQFFSYTVSLLWIKKSHSLFSFFRRSNSPLAFFGLSITFVLWQASILVGKWCWRHRSASFLINNKGFFLNLAVHWQLLFLFFKGFISCLGHETPHS